MEKIIEAFGLDVRLIIIQLVNFGILMAALSYFLYKPVMRMLDERATKIARGVADAEAAAAARTSAEADKQLVLTSAHGEAAAVVDRARKHAEETEEKLVRDAQAKAAGIVSDAEVRATEAARRLEKESEAEIAKIAVLATEKLLRERAS